MLHLLRTRRTTRFGRLAERGPDPVPLADPHDSPPTDPAIILDGELDVIEFTAPIADGNQE